mmetsp:Transcript_15193/g.34650  ORF Transcript_15193/g.34650 Transcript_15193/m.34650 type:complete len:344 (+) Transcript_15193:53-1084(+)
MSQATRRSKRLQELRASGDGDIGLALPVDQRLAGTPGTPTVPGTPIQPQHDRLTVLPLSVVDPESAMWYHKFIERWFNERAVVVRDCYYRLRKKTKREEAHEARLRLTRQEIHARHAKVSSQLQREVSKAKSLLQDKMATLDKERKEREANDEALRQLREELQAEARVLEDRKATLLQEMSSTTVAPLVKPKVQRAAIAKMSARRISKVTQPSRIAPAAAVKQVQRPLGKAAAKRTSIVHSGTIARTLAARGARTRASQGSSGGGFSLAAKRPNLPDPPQFVGEAVGKVGKGLKPLKVKQPPAGSFGIIQGGNVGDIGVELPPHIEFIGEPVGKGMKVSSSRL